MRVIRWNHSGDPATNPEQHNPVELQSVPRPDPVTGGHARQVSPRTSPTVAECVPFCSRWMAPAAVSAGSFKIRAARSIFTYLSWLMAGDFGAPIENLKAAMKDAGLQSVDLWIGTGGAPLATLVQPILKPKAYLPVHWDGLYGAFEAGVQRLYRDPALEELLRTTGVTLISPVQYMDKWRLDSTGVRPVENSSDQTCAGLPVGEEKNMKLCRFTAASDPDVRIGLITKDQTLLDLTDTGVHRMKTLLELPGLADELLRLSRAGLARTSVGSRSADNTRRIPGSVGRRCDLSPRKASPHDRIRVQRQRLRSRLRCRRVRDFFQVTSGKGCLKKFIIAPCPPISSFLY